PWVPRCADGLPLAAAVDFSALHFCLPWNSLFPPASPPGPGPAAGSFPRLVRPGSRLTAAGVPAANPATLVTPTVGYASLDLCRTTEEKGETHDQEQSHRHAAGQSTSRNEGASDRVAAGLGGGARADAGEGNGRDARPRRPLGRTPADAVDGRREGV